MAPPAGKAQFLRRVYTMLKRHYGRKKQVTVRPPLEQLISGLLAENATEREAGEALRRFKADYVDWNEVRVSTPREVEKTLGDLPERQRKAQALLEFLGGLFEREYALELPWLDSLSLRDAVKRLRRLPGLTEYAIGTLVQQTLGGHAVPVDESLRRIMARLQVCEADVPLTDLAASLERLVAKSRSYAFSRLMQELAADVCGPGEPMCHRCVLVKACPTGKARTRGEGRAAG